MKCRGTQAMLIIAFMGIFLPVWAQRNYYVVVGAISTEGEETEIRTKLPTFNQDTAYAMSDQKSTVHLYVLKSTSRDEALERSLNLQRSIEENNVFDGNYQSVTILNGEASIDKSSNSNTQAELTADASSARDGSERGAFSATPVKTKSNLFRFTIQDNHGQLMPGKVYFVDLDRERDLASYPTATYTDLINPGKNTEMALVCGIFGYKLAEKFIDYENPSEIEGAYKDENDAWVIPYALERLEKGDVSVMYNVAFHKDAVLMLPPSKSDLDELVRMMRENKSYEITVHGHCNGKNERRILTVSNPDDLFNVSAGKHIYGSAKLLSALRAEAVKQYLINNGIEPNRIKIYAWGGRYELVEPESSYARLNDRIEIEIRKD